MRCLGKVLYLSGRVTRPVWETPRPLGGSPAHQHFPLNPLCETLRVGRACALRLRGTLCAANRDQLYWTGDKGQTTVNCLPSSLSSSLLFLSLRRTIAMFKGKSHELRSIFQIQLGENIT